MNTVSYFPQPLLIKPPARSIPITIAVLAHVVILIVMGKGLMVHFKPAPEPPTEFINVPPESQPEPPTHRPIDTPLPSSQITLAQPEIPVIDVEPDAKPPTVVSITGSDPPHVGETITSPDVARVAPHLVYQTEPPYPAASIRSGEEGLVKLLITIAANGRVLSAQVQESSGSKRLDQAAIEAVRSWKYSPAERGGMSISETIPVLIRFSLK